MNTRSGALELYAWNPRRHRVKGPLGRWLTYGPRKDNFGDLLGPIIVRRILDLAGLKTSHVRGQLLTVGSVLHFAKPGDHVWGTGRNGKVTTPPASPLNVYAVRGPLTQRYLLGHGIPAPSVFGDPALLVPHLFPEIGVHAGEDKHELSVLNNLNDVASFPEGAHVISPTDPVETVIQEILRSKFLATSSLHGLIIAEAFGIPVRLVRSAHEPLFKYEDYYEGTGRALPALATDFAEALSMGPDEAMSFDGARLLEAFPKRLWSKS